MAHEIPYVATATVAELRDLEYKVERAMEFRGARYIHIFVPCPLGWGSASRDTIRVARLVKETGLFPVFEAEHGEVVSVSRSAGRCRSRSTSSSSAAMPTCSARTATGRDRRSRRSPTATSAATACSPTWRRAPTFPATPRTRRPARERRTPSEIAEQESNLCASPRAIRSLADGEALRHHARRRHEPRQQDGLVNERAVYTDRSLPATTPVPPARTSRAGCEGEEGGDGYERAWRKIMEDNPFPAIMGRVCYHPARRPATAASSTRRSGSTR